MLPGLNYHEEDDKFIILGNIFQISEGQKSKNVMSRMGFKNRNMCVIQKDKTGTTRIGNWNSRATNNFI